jgi:hypothetical protein
MNMARTPADSERTPAVHPDPARNTGYAEPTPKNKEQAQVPGAKQPPGDEEGGLDHAPDQTT